MRDQNNGARYCWCWIGFVNSWRCHNTPFFSAYAGNSRLGQLDFGQGGVHTIYVAGNQDLGYEQTISDFRLTADNSINMFWLFPQYLVITMGEIMFSVTGLEFSYSQVKYRSRGHWGRKVPSSIPAHVERISSWLSRPSIRAGIEEGLQAQWRPHHDKGRFRYMPVVWRHEWSEISQMCLICRLYEHVFYTDWS